MLVRTPTPGHNVDHYASLSSVAANACTNLHAAVRPHFSPQYTASRETSQDLEHDETSMCSLVVSPDSLLLLLLCIQLGLGPQPRSQTISVQRKVCFPSRRWRCNQSCIACMLEKVFVRKVSVEGCQLRCIIRECIDNYSRLAICHAVCVYNVHAWT